MLLQNKVVVENCSKSANKDINKLLEKTFVKVLLVNNIYKW